MSRVSTYLGGGERKGRKVLTYNLPKELGEKEKRNGGRREIGDTATITSLLTFFSREERRRRRRSTYFQVNIFPVFSVRKGRIEQRRGEGKEGKDALSTPVDL